MAALATTDDVAAMLQRDLTDAEVPAVQKALDQASGAIRRYCRQTISLVTDDSVVLAGAYGRKFVLPERPIVEVTSISVAGLVIASGLYSIVHDELWIGPKLSQVGNAAEYAGGGWGSPAVDVEVVYSHGFDPVPDEIAGLCIGMAQRYVANPTGIALSGETLSKYSYTEYRGDVPANAFTLTGDDKAMLAPYRRSWYQ